MRLRMIMNDGPNFNSFMNPKILEQATDLTANELLTTLAGYLHNFAPNDRKRVIQAVNEYEALCKAAEALAQFTQCSQVRDIVSGDTELALAVIAARHALSALNSIRKP